MSEINLQSAISHEPPASMPGEALAQAELQQNVMFGNTLDRLERSGVDMSPEKKETIANAGKELIQDFGLTEKFFEDEAKSTVFAAIAQEYAEVKDSTASVGEITARKEFLADTLVLMAAKDSAFSEIYSKSDAEEGPSEALKLATYDTYTNRQVSEELFREMETGTVLGDIKAKLGITAENQDPFEVRVLNVASNDGMETYGVFPSMPEDIGDKEWGSPEWKDWQDTRAKSKEYEDGLKKNGKAFNNALGREDSFAPAWVTRVGEKTFLCLPLPTAEKILYENEERAKHYAEGDRERDIAIFKHEYTHTQKMLAFNHQSYIGIGLEELRAEHFSGDKHGYNDIKNHFRAMAVVGGFNAKKAFENRPEGEAFDQAAYYTNITKHVGLDGLLDTVVVFPGNYIADEETNKLQLSINSYVGGLSGMQKKMFIQAEAEGRMPEVEERMTGLLTTISKSMDPVAYINYTGRGSYFAERMTALWQRIKPEDYIAPGM